MRVADGPDGRADGPDGGADAIGWRVARTIDVACTFAGWGFVIGLAAVAMHLWWWGLVLGAGATLVTAYALRPGWMTRLPYAVGWVVPVVLAMVPRPEGDYAVAGDAYGYSLVAIGMVLIVLTTSTLPLGRRPPQQEQDAQPRDAQPQDAEAREAGTAPDTEASREPDLEREPRPGE